VIASVAVAALFLMGYLGRKAYPEELLGGMEKTVVRRELATVVFAATGLQLVAGPLVFFTLPPRGLSWALVLNIFLGAGLAVAALALLWREVKSPTATVGIRYLVTVVLLGGTVIFMGYGRHLYREQALAPHRAAMAEKSLAYRSAVLGAQMRQAAGTLRVGGAELSASPGERVFRAVCMACHARDERRVGPPLSEIVQIYDGNPDGFIQWVRSPGRKRTDYSEMPPIRMRDDQYRAVAAYVLEEVFAADGEVAPEGDV
jgi:cytochrome c